MSTEVEHSEHPGACPRDRFHPVYDSFTEWLDSEAPPTASTAKIHNGPRGPMKRRVIRRNDR